jgi:large subunit ribosomal protein L18
MPNAKAQTNRSRSRARIRAKVSGTAERPRLSVFKSNTALTVQLIDDVSGVTLAAARGKDAGKLGAEIAKVALAKGVSKAVFDRGGYIYTGKVRALAEAARTGGLTF